MEIRGPHLGISNQIFLLGDLPQQSVASLPIQADWKVSHLWCQKKGNSLSVYQVCSKHDKTSTETHLFKVAFVDEKEGTKLDTFPLMMTHVLQVHPSILDSESSVVKVRTMILNEWQ